MSRGSNAEVVRAIFAAWNRDDMEAVLEHLDPEAELVPLRAQLEGTSYRGHDGVRQLHSDLNAEWERMQLTVDELREVGADRVVARSTLTARGRASGVELEIPIGWLIELRDGKVIRSQSFSNPDGAFRAAGLEDSG